RRDGGSAASAPHPTALGAVPAAVADARAVHVEAAAVVARLVVADREVVARGAEAEPAVRGGERARDARVVQARAHAVAAVRGRDRARHVVPLAAHAEALAAVARRLVAGLAADRGLAPPGDRAVAR